MNWRRNLDFYKNSDTLVGMKPNQKDIDIAEWVELDAMKREIRNVFASLLKTDEISADEINAIHNILFKKKK
jgi:hypothetical protein